MLDHRMLLGFPNRIDEAALTGGAYAPTMPLDNLKNREISDVARTVDLALTSTQFDLDLGSARRVRILGLIGHTISLRGKIRWRAFSDAAKTVTVYDSGWKNAFGSIIGASWDINELEWRSSNWYLGTFNAEELEGFTAVCSEILVDNVSARYWRVEIDDQSNPDGFLDMGFRMFIGEAWQPRINREYGGGLGYEDPSTAEATLGGNEYFDERRKYRVQRFSLAHMRSDEGYGTALQIQRRAGTTREIFVVPAPNKPTQYLYRNFLGRFRQLSALEEAAWENGDVGHAMAFEVKEL